MKNIKEKNKQGKLGYSAPLSPTRSPVKRKSPRKINLKNVDYILNLQGDEPNIEKEDIVKLEIQTGAPRTYEYKDNIFTKIE